MSEVIPLPSTQINQAVAVLNRAFNRDPLYVYLIPDDDRRTRLLSSFHDITIRYALRYGEVYTTEGNVGGNEANVGDAMNCDPTLAIEGVACWLSPGNTTPSLWRLLRVALRGAPLLFGFAGYRHYAPVGEYVEKIHHQAVSGPHWYLWGLGVDPSHQRQGLGGRLIQPILARADRDHLPCYLETMNEVNLPFYEKHGFKVMSDGIVPGTELHVWGMRRG